MDWTIWTSPKPSVYCLTHDLCTHPNPVLPLHPYPLMAETTVLPFEGGQVSIFCIFCHGECKKKTFLTLAGDMTHGKDFFSARILFFQVIYSLVRYGICSKNISMIFQSGRSF